MDLVLWKHVHCTSDQIQSKMEYVFKKCEIRLYFIGMFQILN
jgi:hypothetical protein